MFSQRISGSLFSLLCRTNRADAAALPLTSAHHFSLWLGWPGRCVVGVVENMNETFRAVDYWFPWLPAHHWRADQKQNR